MDIDTDLATKNIFRRRCPTRAVCCPIHEKKMCVRYIQPRRPESFRPMRCYESPTSPLQSETVYHLSYRNLDTKGARPPPAVLRGNITFPDAPLEDSTTMALSYPWNFQAPPKPFRPEAVYHGPIAPLQEMTTQRHDFPAKPIDRVENYRPQTNLHPPCAKMEDRTITMESFLPVQPEPTHSYKPTKGYEAPTIPLEKDTITQLSFMPPEMPERETYPWMIRAGYQAPDVPMVDDTIYNGSYPAPGTFEKCSSEPNLIEGEICYCKFPKADEDL